MITELKTKVETSEQEAKEAEQEAITFIEEGIEATYVVNKQQEVQRKQEVQQKTEQEYSSKKVKYEEETSKWTRKLNEQKTLKATAESELKILTTRITTLKK